MRYVCIARLDGTSIVFLWESGDAPDRVVLHDDGAILAFPSELAARADSSPEAAAVYDLDAIEAWCNSNEPPRDCNALLNAWNLLGDLPRGDLFARADAAADAVNRKLFHACNLPAMKPGEHYVPRWEAAELEALRHVLLLGLAEFRGRLRRKETR